MRYLTKEWCNLSQCTGLHYNLVVHKDAGEFDENLYQQLRKIKEKDFLKREKELYDLDPRALFKEDGMTFVRADKFIAGEEIDDEDTIVYEIPEEQKEYIHKLAETYDTRGPFDINECKSKFENMQKQLLEVNEMKIPKEIFKQIADPRVFALGYSTKEIINQLKQMSKENEAIIQQQYDEYLEAQKAEDIPEYIEEHFGFHDCRVMSIEKKNDITFLFDTSGGFTYDNRLVFHDARVIHEDREIVGCWWIYDELYKTQDGYEAHMVFADEYNLYIELTIAAKDITVDRL